MIMLMGCASPTLDAPELEDRWAAFLALDADELHANAPDLLVRSRMEPDPSLRREIIREMGLTGDAEVRAELVRLLGDPELRAPAAESLSFDRPDGCRILAERWVSARSASGLAPTRFVASDPLGSTLRAVFRDISPECRPVLEALSPDDADTLAPATLPLGPPEDPLPAPRTGPEVFASAGVWVALSGTWASTEEPILTLDDGTELVIHEDRRWNVPDGARVEVIGVPTRPRAGAEDRRMRLSSLTGVRAP